MLVIFCHFKYICSFANRNQFQANPKQADFIDEEEFMSLAKQLSAEDLSLILQFKIIPVDVFTQE